MGAAEYEGGRFKRRGSSRAYYTEASNGRVEEKQKGVQGEGAGIYFGRKQ